jgi:preprotein translocase subunit SecB
MADAATPVNFSVHNIYVKDISFEAPNSPQIFKLEWKPKLEFDIEMGRARLEDDLYEVTMSITVKVSIENQLSDDAAVNKQTAFVVEVKQAGIFMLQGVTDAKQIDYILSTAAPTILFPYARQMISSLVMQGAFPQLIVPPMNFDAMYQQHLAEQQQAKSPEVATA